MLDETLLLHTKTATIIEKPWGREEIIETNDRYTVKRLLMRAGHQCSYQYHDRKMETVIGLQGNLTIIHESGQITLSPGQAITILPGQKHRMAATTHDCLYLECSTSELDDVIRIADDYGRS